MVVTCKWWCGKRRLDLLCKLHAFEWQLPQLSELNYTCVLSSLASTIAVHSNWI